MIHIPVGAFGWHGNWVKMYKMHERIQKKGISGAEVDPRRGGDEE